MSTILQAWCPTCAEMSMPDDRGRCVWCDTPTRAEEPKRRGKPVGKWGYLTDDQVRALHRVYMSGRSLRAIAAALHPRTRYASPKSMANCLHDAFVRLGLPRREQSEATAAANVARGSGLTRRELRVARGEVLDRPQCAGVRVGYPRKGAPCGRPAMADSDYCIAHDPARRAEMAERLALARSRRAA